MLGLSFISICPNNYDTDYYVGDRNDSFLLRNLDYQYLGSIFGMIFHFGMCFSI